MPNSFIHEFLLLTSIRDEKELSIRLEMGRFLYNAVLTEGFKRIKLLKQSTLYKSALKKLGMNINFQIMIFKNLQ